MRLCLLPGCDFTMSVSISIRCRKSETVRPRVGRFACLATLNTRLSTGNSAPLGPARLCSASVVCCVRSSCRYPSSPARRAHGTDIVLLYISANRVIILIVDGAGRVLATLYLGLGFIPAVYIVGVLYSGLTQRSARPAQAWRMRATRLVRWRPGGGLVEACPRGPLSVCRPVGDAESSKFSQI